MRRMLSKIRRLLVSPIKRRLDRRYVTHGEIRDEILQNLHSLTVELRALVDQAIQDHVAGEEHRAAAHLSSLATNAKDIAGFVGHHDPQELRQRLFAAHRLANECAQSIELLMQADIVLRRDLDAVSVSE